MKKFVGQIFALEDLKKKTSYAVQKRTVALQIVFFVLRKILPSFYIATILARIRKNFFLGCESDWTYIFCFEFPLCFLLYIRRAERYIPLFIRYHRNVHQEWKTDIWHWFPIFFIPTAPIFWKEWTNVCILHLHGNLLTVWLSERIITCLSLVFRAASVYFPLHKAILSRVFFLMVELSV